MESSSETGATLSTTSNEKGEGVLHALLEMKRNAASPWHCLVPAMPESL